VVSHCPSKCLSRFRNWSGLPCRLILLLLVYISLAGPLFLAAQTTSIVQGTVTDQQHLAITEAEISLSSPTLPRDIRTATDFDGSYRVAGLQPGSYDLRVSKNGFADKTYRGLTVTLNRLSILDVVMAISPVKEEITVSGDPPLLETTISLDGSQYPPTANRANAN
jgi:Carboxypeptidase regulatory-like domain